MLTLGINYGSHDSAAAIALDGEILFATAEERLTRTKHDGGFPVHAIRAAFAHAEVKLADLDQVAFGWQPLAAVRSVDLRNYLTGAHPMRWREALKAQTVGRIVEYQRDGERLFRRHVGSPKNGFKRIDHHYAHALSAYPVSGFDEATVVVIDGRGAWEATSIWHGKGTELKLIDMIRWPNSIGLFYAQFTWWLGFERFQDEWKVMGLAPYGGPGIDLGGFIRVSDGQYSVNSRLLLQNLYGIEKVLGPARKPDESLSDRHRDVAWAVQDACERAELAVIRRAVSLTGSRNLCLAGGVALNSKANGLILSERLVDRIFIQPAATDDGVAIGAALAAPVAAGFRCGEMTKAYLGSQSAPQEIEAALRTYKLSYERLDDSAETAAELLTKGKLIGWYQGREEFGPRALGNRSILADPRDVRNRDRVNNAVKFREDWRPFAPSVLEEAGASLFESYHTTPFMTLTFQVRPEKKEAIAAAVHVDGSARVQSVTRDQNERYYDLIKNFAVRTGVPAVLNTSFNLKGEPIVNSPFDAIRTFYTSGLDGLFLDRWLIQKTPSPKIKQQYGDDKKDDSRSQSQSSDEGALAGTLWS
jgi:carbamoyltransferase